MPGDPWELIWVLYVSGLLSVRQGDEETARDRFAEALELAREARDHMMAALRSLPMGGRHWKSAISTKQQRNSVRGSGSAPTLASR